VNSTSSPHHPSGDPPGASYASLQRLTDELERWGSLFVDVAAAKGVSAAEQVLGGLVDWMGNGLIDGWLHLPIPLFEKLSDLAEELFQACQAYLGQLKAEAQTIPVDERALHESRIRDVLGRVRSLTEKS
jgi:hypothetical protein